jgi:hypothetical protein
MSARQRRQKENRRRHHEKSRRRRLIATGGLTAGATLAITGVAHAAPQTYTVGTNTDDSTGGACLTPTNTDCSLREALDLSNTNADADTIVFNSNLTGQTITLTSADLPITDGVTITGPGASQLTVDGDYSYRAFLIDPTTADDPVSISGLTLTNGYGINGGAIHNEDADLTISGAVVSDSDASNRGGGINSFQGSLTINSSTVSGNYSYTGGGIAAKYSETLITDSTVSGNTAIGSGPPEYSYAYGGGVWAQSATVTVDRSTINDNYAYDDGGGIYSDEGDVNVRNTTITGNHAVTDDGGGVWVGVGALTVVSSTVTQNTAVYNAGGLNSYSDVDQVIQNSIVSGNTSDPGTAQDLDAHGFYFDTAFSLIGITNDDVTTTVPGSNLFGVDPQLGALANNGGPTESQLPANTSPVIDKGSSFMLDTDQRGLTRPIEIPSIPNSTAAGADGADMGAVEVQSVPASSTPAPTTPAKKKKKCKRKKKKRSAESAKKKKCKKKKKKK